MSLRYLLLGETDEEFESDLPLDAAARALESLSSDVELSIDEVTRDGYEFSLGLTYGKIGLRFVGRLVSIPDGSKLTGRVGSVPGTSFSG